MAGETADAQPRRDGKFEDIPARWNVADGKARAQGVRTYLSTKFSYALDDADLDSLNPGALEEAQILLGHIQRYLAAVTNAPSYELTRRDVRLYLGLRPDTETVSEGAEAESEGNIADFFDTTPEVGPEDGDLAGGQIAGGDPELGTVEIAAANGEPARPADKSVLKGTEKGYLGNKVWNWLMGEL